MRTKSAKGRNNIVRRGGTMPCRTWLEGSHRNLRAFTKAVLDRCQNSDARFWLEILNKILVAVKAAVLHAGASADVARIPFSEMLTKVVLLGMRPSNIVSDHATKLPIGLFESILFEGGGTVRKVKQLPTGCSAQGRTLQRKALW